MLIMKIRPLLATLAFAAPLPALAAPGLGQNIYGAEVKSGETEVEVRFDSLNGGADHGEDVLKLGIEHGVSDRLKLGINAEIEQEPGASHQAEELAFEAIYRVGSAGGVHFALYGEYGVGLNGHADKVETKLIVQSKPGSWDLRFNLIGQKKLETGRQFELGYAVSADTAVAGDLRLGVEVFGELGANERHFAGPLAKIEIEGLGPEVGLSAGYLFALGNARNDTSGQFRLGVKIEF